MAGWDNFAPFTLQPQVVHETEGKGEQEVFNVIALVAGMPPELRAQVCLMKSTTKALGIIYMIYATAESPPGRLPDVMCMQYAMTVAMHTDYHLRVGFTGTLVLADFQTVSMLASHAASRALIDSGRYSCACMRSELRKAAI